jgi:hypothetical protein
MDVLTETLRQINAELAGTAPTGANSPDRRERSPDLRLTSTGSLADDPTEGPK